MRKSQHFPTIVYDILLVFGLIAIWITLAPTQYGGQLSYVIVNGNSMEPNFHTGDLIIVRNAEEYQVGDVVLYHDPLTAADIIHRIIALDQDRFIVKGDNNSWNDSYHPTQFEIVGKKWIYLPKIGLAIEWIRIPINTALIGGLLGGYFMISMIRRKPKKKRGKGGRPLAIFEIALYVAGTLVLVFLTLSIISFTRPLERTADNIPYKQIGSFLYSADGTSSVYDTGAARSGEPIFVNLTCNLNLTFNYYLQGEHLEKISGEQNIYAMVMDEQSGWQRTIPLTTTKNFVGNSYSSTVSLDLCQVQDLVLSVEQETGFHSSTYTMVIESSVAISGKISDQEFSDTFEPHLTFRFDSLHFYLIGVPSQADPLQTIQSGSLTNSSLVENTFNLFGLKLIVWKMRIISVIGLVLSLSGLLVLTFIFYTASKRDQVAVIKLKYGPLLMDVHDRGVETLSPIIDVLTIDDLAKLAERQNTVILHQIRTLRRNYIHFYFVQSGGTTYRYVMAEPDGKGDNSPSDKGV